MKVRMFLFVFFLIIYSCSFSFNYLFPNQILYQSRPAVGVKYTAGAVDLLINTRFSVDTLFRYKVYDPLLAGLIQTESSFYLHAVSDSNALGLFQMKPFIASEIRALNPFNPNNDKKVSALLDKYTNDYNQVDYALGAYHIGYYGVQNFLNSGNNPMDDKRIYDYVQKIKSFQRLYKEGDRVPLKDYVWLDVSMSLTDLNLFSTHIVIPEYFLGSIALGVKKEEDFHVSLYQEFTFSWFLNAYIGYDNGLITGLTLKSNDWYDRLTVKYDFSKDDLIWTAGLSFNYFSVEFGCSKNSLFMKPAVVIEDRYFFEIPLYYIEHRFIPGVSVVIRF
ncbi:MAG: transglycosylase SLT domain-containing protein [Bacteroidota bacterium]